MHIHEFQAKQLLDKYGIAVPRGDVASTVDGAANVAQKLGGGGWVIKSQIHAGGRRNGRFEGSPDGEGGVRFTRSIDEVRSNAEQMLGHVLVTEQTGPAGREVERVYIEEACDVQRELYLAMFVDRETGRVSLIAAPEGGIDIESTAVSVPESIQKLTIDPSTGVDQDGAQKLAVTLGLDGGPAEAMARIILAMYEMFIALDASLIEINPLALNAGGQMLALDATLTFDDNALFRHPDIQALRDASELRMGELEAARHGINYLKLDGNVGCMASGAGLAMATIDAIKSFGGEPANFLDVPPVAQADRVKEAFILLLSDPGVTGVLVNVFGGGIVRCDTIADGIILANREVPVRVPLIARLTGTSAGYAVRRLTDSGPAVTFARDLADAAEQAVKAANAAKRTMRRSWWDRMQGLMSKNDGSGGSLTR